MFFLEWKFIGRLSFIIGMELVLLHLYVTLIHYLNYVPQCIPLSYSLSLHGPWSKLIQPCCYLLLKLFSLWAETCAGYLTSINLDIFSIKFFFTKALFQTQIWILELFQWIVLVTKIGLNIHKQIIFAFVFTNLIFPSIWSFICLSKIDKDLPLVVPCQLKAFVICACF